MQGDTKRFSAGSKWIQACLCLVCAGAIICVAQDGGKAPMTNATAPGPATQVSAEGGKAQSGDVSRQEKAAGVDTDRKKQIADESTQLLSMALALKAEVDKTTKDTLSMNVIRKADEIEKLAHTVKEKMKQSAGAS